jgi:hypothetical protein
MCFSPGTNLEPPTYLRGPCRDLCRRNNHQVGLWCPHVHPFLSKHSLSTYRVSDSGTYGSLLTKSDKIIQEETDSEGIRGVTMTTRKPAAVPAP